MTVKILDMKKRTENQCEGMTCKMKLAQATDEWLNGICAEIDRMSIA